MNTITHMIHMITKYESKYGCRYMYTSYHTDINLYVDTKIWAKSTCSNLKSPDLPGLSVVRFGRDENFPPLIFFRTQLSSLNLALPCGLPASPASPAWILEGFTPFTSLHPRFLLMPLSTFRKKLPQPKQWHEATTCNPETSPKTLLHPSQLFGRPIIIADSCQTMETTWNDLPQSSQSPQCPIAIHLLKDRNFTNENWKWKVRRDC